MPVGLIMSDTDTSVFVSMSTDMEPHGATVTVLVIALETRNTPTVATDARTDLSESRTASPSSNAQGKLEKKNFDFIVLNSLADKGAGFGFDTNKVSIIERNGTITNYELKSKKAVAQDIANHIEQLKK